MDQQRIVVGVDGSEGARSALQWAVDEAGLRGAIVEAVHVWNPAYVNPYPYTISQFELHAEHEAAEKLVHEAVSSVDTSQMASAPKPVLAKGHAAQALLSMAEGADLVVVGSRGRGGFSGLMLGSVSQQVAAHAGCPVVVIPARRHLTASGQTDPTPAM